MKNRNFFSKVLLLGIISSVAIASTSCRTAKNVEFAAPPLVYAKDTMLKRQTKVDSVFMYMKINELKFQTLQTKFSADYSSESQKYNFGGQIRIRKDSAIWVSISPGLGIEMFRVVISQDSIKMLDRIKKTYFSAPVSYFNKMLNTNLDYDMLQSLLVGSDFPYYETNVFDIINLGNDYLLSTIGRKRLKRIVAANENYEKVLVQNMRVDKDNYRIQKQSVKQVNDPNKKIDVDYSNFQFVTGQLFPSLVKVKLEDAKSIFLNLEYEKTTFDEEMSFPMKVPENYTVNIVNE